MSRNQLLFVFGLLLIGIPFSGFPHLWKIIIYVIIGLLLICLSALSYLRHLHVVRTRQKHMQDVYVENANARERLNRKPDYEEPRQD